MKKEDNHENYERQVPRPFNPNGYDQTDKLPKQRENVWNQKRIIHHVRMASATKHILNTICYGFDPIAPVHNFTGSPLSAEQQKRNIEDVFCMISLTLHRNMSRNLQKAVHFVVVFRYFQNNNKV